MDTVEQRIARLEVLIEQLLELVHSGPSVPWDQSIRGRLHRVLTYQAGADKLAEAARDLRRAQGRHWSRAERTAALAVAIAAAAAPYVLFALHAG